MMSTDTTPAEADDGQNAAVNAVLGSGATGAIVLAGTGTAVVVALWFAFYLLVFVPRATGP